MTDKLVCRDFQRGDCRYGNNCRFNHIDPIKKIIENNEYDVTSKNKNHKNRHKLKKVNTETFDPVHTPADMRLLIEPAKSFGKCGLNIRSRDVVVVPGLFCDTMDLSIYNRLMDEMSKCGISNDKLWKTWHGDNHLIADDHMNYKEKVPTFLAIIQKIRDYFDMDIKATRFNLYRDDVEWKPFHHDASAVDPEKAKIQNFTVGVSFGATRDIAFEDAMEEVGHRRVISIPLVNGMTYCFSRDINTNWRHGVPQLPPNLQGKNGRISIIAWGSIRQEEAL